MTGPDSPLTEASPPEKLLMLTEELLKDIGSNATRDDLAHLLGCALACVVVLRDESDDLELMARTVATAEEAAFDFRARFMRLAEQHGIAPD